MSSELLSILSTAIHSNPEFPLGMQMAQEMLKTKYETLAAKISSGVGKRRNLRFGWQFQDTKALTLVGGVVVRAGPATVTLSP